MNDQKMAALLGFSLLTMMVWMMVSNTWGQNPDQFPRVFDGRMAGGGSIFTDANDLFAPAGTRLVHSFDLHCDYLKTPNNLEVNIHLPNGDGGRFHLDQLQFAWCWDNPDIQQKPPAAPFDSYFGSGIGRYNGVPGYCADWLFTDEGEPATKDRIRSMRIWKPATPADPAANPCANEEAFLFSIYLAPGHTLTFGNHQARKDAGTIDNE